MYFLIATEWLPQAGPHRVFQEKAVNRELTAGSSDWLHVSEGWYIVRRDESAPALNVKLMALGGSYCRILVVPLGRSLPWMTGYLPQDAWQWINARINVPEPEPQPLTDADAQAAVDEALRMLKGGQT